MAVTATATELTPADVETFFDGLIPDALRTGDIAGGVIAVSRDGQVLFARGYGYADLESRRPMSAETLIRPGSIGKTVTATAAMQLVEQKRLDLDRDINDYLDFRIDSPFGTAITLRHLLTHTAGFEDTTKGYSTTDATRLVSLGSYLKAHLPERIFPPGKIVAYSNYGFSVVGYIVERVSGEKFDDYVANHIFRPLLMPNSTFTQPPPERFMASLSSSYQTASSRAPVPYEYFNVAPAGAYVSSALDMANFMMAHLQEGRFGDARILGPETIRLMHGVSHRSAPGMNGYTLGFWQEDRNGLRILGHSGSASGFESDMHLLLDKNIGIFLSLNGRGRQGASGIIKKKVLRSFLDRYFPQELPDEPTLSTARADAARVAGWYVTTRRSDSGVRIGALLGQTKVSASSDGTIRVETLRDYSGAPKRWREIGPLVYREVDGQARLVFVTDGDGQISYLTTDDRPPASIDQRVPAWRSKAVVLPSILLTACAFIIAVLAWCGGAIVRRLRGRTLQLTQLAHRFRRFSRLGATVALATLAGWPALFAAVLSNPDLMAAFAAGAADFWLHALFTLSALSLVGVAAILVNSVFVWIDGTRGIGVKLGETALAVAGLALMVFICSFGMVSFDARF